jgi:hypothetical protein
LPPEEKEAVSSLRIDKEGSLPEDDISDTEVEEITIQEEYERKRKREIKIKSGVYMNPGFIVGSAAEIRRVWSAGGLIINKKRCKTIPMNFEALLFLKINKKHWDKRMVVKAFRLVKDKAYPILNASIKKSNKRWNMSPIRTTTYRNN